MSLQKILEEGLLLIQLAMEKRELDRDLKRMGRKRKGGENQTYDDAPLLAGAS